MSAYVDVQADQIREALDIADHFIEYSGYTKTNLQVLKLTYISHGYMLAIHDTPLMHDDVQAWRCGPVIPSIYNRFKKYGSGIIAQTSSTPKQFNSKEKEILDSVFKYYGRYCGYYLSQITHDDGDLRTPWKQCYVPGINAIIPDEITKKYYKKLIFNE